MSTSSEGPNNIETIRQLLQKIEQAAVEDADKPSEEAKPGRPGAKLELASLSRGGPLAVTPLTPQAPLAARELNIPLDPSELEEAEAPAPRRTGLRLVAVGLATVLVGGGIVAFVHQNELRTLARGAGLLPAEPAVVAKAPAAAQSTSVRPASEPVAKGGGNGAGAGAGPTISGQVSSAQPVPVPDPRTSGKAGPAVLPVIALTVEPGVTVQAGEALTFPVKLEPMPTESDALLLIIRGVPEEMAFSQGSAIGNEIWLLPAHRATDLTLSSADNLDGAFPLVIDLVAVDGRMVAQARTELTVKAAFTPTPRASVDDDELKRLVARGDKLLETGDVMAARAWFERAAEAGSATGAFRLGETFDPLMLLSLGVRSISTGDDAAARRWYERAAALGHQGAADRLRELKR